MSENGILVKGSAASFVAIKALPKEAVMAMLPKGLDLAPQEMTPPDQHPVILAFNRQQDVHMVWGSLRGPGFTYYEFSVGISYVRFGNKAGAETFFFAPQLYLNNWVPVLIGRFWGFAKSLEDVAVTPDTWAIRSRSNKLSLISGDFVRQGESGSPSHFKTFSQIQQLLDQRGLGMPPWGGFSCFELKQQLDQATVQAVAASITISQPFLPKLPTGTFEVPGIESTALGAFHLSVPWYLKLPKRCSPQDNK